jgi:hypothetical protein
MGGPPARVRVVCLSPSSEAARLTTCKIRGLCRQTGTEPQSWETGQMDSITYVGIDVHKATIAVAVADGGRLGEVRQLGARWSSGSSSDEGGS